MERFNKSFRTRALPRVLQVFPISLIVLLSTLTLFLFTPFVLGAGGLSTSEARKLISRVAGINLPSNSVRIKEISALGSSAVVVAQLETAFKFTNQNGKWAVTEIRTGENSWERIEGLEAALNAERTARARAELNSLVTALDAFHRDRGVYVESKSEATLVDHLSPKYLNNVIRIDPWQRPYEYLGTVQGFELRSAGPDGKSGTGDDIVINK